MKNENTQEITKEPTNKVIRNEIQFQENHVSTAKINNNETSYKNEISCKTKLRSIEASTKNGASI